MKLSLEVDKNESKRRSKQQKVYRKQNIKSAPEFETFHYQLRVVFFAGTSLPQFSSLQGAFEGYNIQAELSLGFGVPDEKLGTVGGGSLLSAQVENRDGTCTK